MTFDEERRNKIVTDHPNLFPGYFCFEHQDGWLDIVENLCHQLEAEVIKEKKEKTIYEDEEFYNDFVVTQIKEKYGRLRFYMSISTEKMQKMIEKAELLSSITCENCGNPGYTRNTAWVTTLCDACAGKK